MAFIKKSNVEVVHVFEDDEHQLKDRETREEMKKAAETQETIKKAQEN